MVIIGWDENKNIKNVKNHKVSFEEAQTVITNPTSLFNVNDHPDGDRIEYIGHSLANRLLYVVTVEKTEHYIQIVSARRAELNERRKYEEGI